MQGYPTIKSFANGRWQDYQGDRSAGAIKDAALRLLPDKVPPCSPCTAHTQLMSTSWPGQGKPPALWLCNTCNRMQARMQLYLTTCNRGNYLWLLQTLLAGLCPIIRGRR